MTRDFSSYLTTTSAAFLREALGALARDSFNRHIPEASMGLEAAQMAFDWQANDNKTRFDAILRTDAKRQGHTVLMEEKFREAVQEVCDYAYDERTGPAPLFWDKYFKDFPLPKTVEAKGMPDEKKLRPGSLENGLAWSDYNTNRMAQHRLTLSICEHLVRDAHVFKHLEAPLSRARSWVRAQASQLESIRMQLILLEGDPTKIQALREEILEDVRRPNHSTDHFYGHLNGQSGGNGQADKLFRAQALRHVQAGFEAGTATGANVTYSDLGLG